MRPIQIPPYINQIYNANPKEIATTSLIRERYNKLKKGDPVVSIVIPAYNEEANILQTLLSLSSNQTNWPVEIIVVNNNSKDNTEEIVKNTGITCLTEFKQGVKHARNLGLEKARGIYILNADADTIYPIDWIEEMVKPLAKSDQYCITYGRFSFIPTGNTGRITYFFYEYAADLMRWLNKMLRDESSNVYGFNSCFRKEQGLAVGSFEHPNDSNEDGHLALKLRDNGFGKLYYVTNLSALVWTTDRRIQIDGGILKGTIKRIKRMTKLLLDRF